MTAAPTLTSPKQSADSKSGLRLLFGALMLAMLLAALNQTLLSTALPTMVGELNGVSQLQWVITAYILASTVMMPIYGKVGDLIGRKGLLIGAILAFMAGSVVGGLAQDMTWLIVGRAIQGIGGGGLIILSQAIIADIVPARERGKYMGLMGAVFAFASVAGPLLGGWFTEGPGWRWTFWINIPLGAVAIVGAVLFLHIPSGPTRRPRLDYAGMALLTVATTALVLVGTWGGSTYEWTSGTIIGLIALSLASALAFVAVEQRASEPIIGLHLFKDRNFNLTTIASLFTGIAMFGALSYMPTYFQMATGESATQAGLLMLPMMGALLVTSVGSGYLVSHTGRYKWMPIAGSAVLALSLVLLSTTQVDTPLWAVCGYLGLLGLGLGVMMQILVLVVQNSFPVSEVGTATAANNYFRQIGASLGAAVVGGVFSARLATLVAERVPGSSASGVDSLTPDVVRDLPSALRLPFVESYNDALMPIFLFIAPLAVVSMILLCFVDEKPLATTIVRDVPEPVQDSEHATVWDDSREADVAPFRDSSQNVRV